MKREDWIWMPHPAHFICARNCKFHLATCVGDFIVSTVGEYLPDAPVREIIADMHGVKLAGQGNARLADFMRKIGYQEIGAGRLYETMVFLAMKGESQDKENACCPYRIADGEELDAGCYNTSADAYRGHLELCEKWATRKAEDYGAGCPSCGSFTCKGFACEDDGDLRFEVPPAEKGPFLCTVCRINPVDALNGYDTCDECKRKA